MLILKHLRSNSSNGSQEVTDMRSTLSRLHYSVSWSGGKDSTASIILAHENNEPIDSIVFVEVMYDLKRNISGENPEHIKFIREVAKPLFESWGYPVYILRANRDFLGFFNRIIDNPRKHLDHKGKRFGFPCYGLCGVKRDLKLKPMNDFYKKIEDLIQYVGICVDEPKRLASLHKQNNRVSLLEKYEYTEEMARQKCIEYGLLSPCYQYSKRGGCWFCPNAKFAEQREIKRLYPDIWKEFIALENEPNIANDKWNIYGKTLHEIDNELEKEIENNDRARSN